MVCLHSAFFGLIFIVQSASEGGDAIDLRFDFVPPRPLAIALQTSFQTKLFFKGAPSE